MTENEMIAEIAQVTKTECPNDFDVSCEDCMYDKKYCCHWEDSKNLMKIYGFRKIPDGAVVLTKEEYSDLLYAQRNYEYAKGKVDELQAIIEKQEAQKIGLAKAYTNARKETATTMYKQVLALFDLIEQTGSYKGKVKEKLREIAELNGVEVDK